MNKKHDDRRRHARKTASFNITIQHAEGLDSETVELRDISEGGMSFLASDVSFFSLGQKLHVNIPEYCHEGNHQQQIWLMEIVWLQPSDRFNRKPWIGLKILSETV